MITNWVKFLVEVVMELAGVLMISLKNSRFHNTIQNMIYHLLSSSLAPGNKKKLFPNQSF